MLRDGLAAMADIMTNNPGGSSDARAFRLIGAADLNFCLP